MHNFKNNTMMFSNAKIAKTPSLGALWKIDYVKLAPSLNIVETNKQDKQIPLK